MAILWLEEKCFDSKFDYKTEVIDLLLRNEIELLFSILVFIKRKHLLLVFDSTLILCMHLEITLQILHTVNLKWIVN